MKITLRKFPIYTEKDGEDVETLYDVEVELTPSTPDVPYLKGGDPGYPGDPGGCEILSIKLNGKEVPSELWEKIGLDEQTIEAIETEACEKSAPDDDDPRGWEPGGN